MLAPKKARSTVRKKPNRTDASGGFQLRLSDEWIDATPVPGTFLINIGDWNQIHIIANGHQLTHIVNGHAMAILIDDDRAALKTKGVIALQIEQYGSGTISFRNIWLKQ